MIGHKSWVFCGMIQHTLVIICKSFIFLVWYGIPSVPYNTIKIQNLALLLLSYGQILCMVIKVCHIIPKIQLLHIITKVCCKMMQDIIKCIYKED